MSLRSRLKAKIGDPIVEQITQGLSPEKIALTVAVGLAIAVNHDPARPNEGPRIAYTVTNRSNTSVFGAGLIVRIPTDGLAAFFATQTSGGGVCTSGVCNPYEFATWNIGTLAPGASVTILAATSVTNGFTSGRLIALESLLVGDGVPMTVARHTVAVDGDNALSLAVDANKDGVAPDDTLTYSLSYGNRSTASVTGI